MQIGSSVPKSRKSITSFRHFSQNNSPSSSKNQLILKDASRILSKNPNRRYNRSTKLQSSNKIQHPTNPLEIPDSFLSTNLRIRQKLRDRSYLGMRSELSAEKTRPSNHPYMKPIVPLKQTYDKIGKEELTTKHLSLFHTNDPEEDQGIEELFYQQVRFLQKCKQLARNSQ